MAATYPIDNDAVRLWSSRPTTNLNPSVAVARIFLYEGGTFRGSEPTGEEEGIAG